MGIANCGHKLIVLLDCTRRQPMRLTQNAAKLTAVYFGLGRTPGGTTPGYSAENRVTLPTQGDANARETRLRLPWAIIGVPLRARGRCLGRAR